MPTYEYECKSCGHSFDAFQHMSEPLLTACPQCGKEVRRIINGGSGIIFKGSGFYVTDKKGRGSTLDAAKPSSKPAKDPQPSSSPVSPSDSSAGSAKVDSEGPSKRGDSGFEKKAAG